MSQRNAHFIGQQRKKTNETIIWHTKVKIITSTLDDEAREDGSKDAIQDT